MTPLKEALSALVDALAKRPAEEILFEWFRSGRLVGELSVLMKRRHPDVQAEIDRVYQEHLAKLAKRRRDPAAQAIDKPDIKTIRLLPCWTAPGEALPAAAPRGALQRCRGVPHRLECRDREGRCLSVVLSHQVHVRPSGQVLERLPHHPRCCAIYQDRPVMGAASRTDRGRVGPNCCNHASAVGRRDRQ